VTIKRQFLLGFTLFFILNSLMGTALAAQIRLAWDANTEKDLAGYMVYYGRTPWNFGEPVKLGKVTNHTLTALTQGETYYIVVTAYDRTKHESGYSNQVSGIAHDILNGEWVFDVSGGDKAGVVIQFVDSDNTFWGYGISDRFNLFGIGGSYVIDDSSSVSGTYTVYDFDDQSVLGMGALSGEVDKKGTTLTLNMENWSSMFRGTLFLKDPYNPKYPVIPEDWTVKVAGALKGTVDPMEIEPYPIKDEIESHVFKISGTGNFTNSGPLDFFGFFLFTPKNMAYGLWDIHDHISGGMTETDFFSGTLNRSMTRFNFNSVGDNGKKSTFTGQAKP
jgi:hypothetical protein